MPRTEEQNQVIREKTKNAILASSLKLFAKRGFNGTSISNIAKEAGISKGLVYNYFESKLEIVEAILKKGLEETNTIDDIIAKVNDPFEKLSFVISSTFDMIQENEEYWRLYFSLTLQPEILEPATIMATELAETFIKRVEKIFKKIGLKNANHEARIFIAILDGLLFQYLYVKHEFPTEKIKKLLIQKYSKENLNKLMK